MGGHFIRGGATGHFIQNSGGSKGSSGSKGDIVLKFNGT